MQFSCQILPESMYVEVQECFAPARAAASNIDDPLETLRTAWRALQIARMKTHRALADIAGENLDEFGRYNRPHHQG